MMLKKLQLTYGGIEADEANTLPVADEAEQADAEQSWPGLFWLPPADENPAERDMLNLDDELAGLIEAADTPAEQARTHSTKPEATVPAPGEVMLAKNKSAAVVPISYYDGRFAMHLPKVQRTVTSTNGVPCSLIKLCCAVLCCAVLCCGLHC